MCSGTCTRAVIAVYRETSIFEDRTASGTADATGPVNGIPLYSLSLELSNTRQHYSGAFRRSSFRPERRAPGLYSRASLFIIAKYYGEDEVLSQLASLYIRPDREVRCRPAVCMSSV